jgi:hypothetical protein
MTVKELIAALMEFPPNAPVFMKSDPEGNSTYAVGDLGTFVGFRGYSGIQEYNAEELDSESCEDQDFVSAVTIWPGYGESFDE